MDERNSLPDKRTRIIIIFSVVLATMMQTLDSTIANVALPHIQGSLSGTQSQIAWVLTSYIIAAAITIPLAGWLASYFGRKRILIISVIGFVFASVLCGIAENLPQIVFFRLLQGIFGAGLIPLSQAVLLSITSRENFGKAMAIWGFGVTMGPILGPLIGGYLTENYSWRWVFYINVPIGLIAFLGIYFYLKEGPIQKRSFDFFGFITLSMAVGFLQLMLDRGELLNWFESKEIIFETIISGLSFYFFLIHTFSQKKSFLNLELFKDRNFTLGMLLIFTLGISLFATLALLPSMLQNQLNYPVVTTGIVTAAQGTGTMFAMLFVGNLIKKFDPRYIIFVGVFLIAYSLWQMSHYSMQMEIWTLLTPGFLQGLGVGLAYIPLGAVAFSNLTSDLHDEGTAFFNLMRNLGSSIGISIVEACLTSNAQRMHSTLGEHITAFNTQFPNIKSAAVMNGLVTNQSFMVAYIDDYYLIMLLTLCVVPAIFFLQKMTQTKKPAVGLE